LKSSKWEKFKWLWRTFWSLKRTPYPRSKWGTGLIIVSIGFPLLNIGLIAVEFSSEDITSSLSYIDKEDSFLSGALALLGVLSGMALIYSEWNNTSRSIAKVLISSMPNTNLEFPEALLDPAEKEFFREPIILGVPSSSTENIEDQIKLYNAELTANIFNRFIIHYKCKKLYIGGLARVPFLVSYGSLLRNTGIDVQFFDKSHKGQRDWTLLNEEKTNLTYHVKHENATSNDNGDIAIAVAFTSPITEEQIPQALKGHTLFINPSGLAERNLIENLETLREAASFISSKIDELSQHINARRIHLFLSIQAPLALAIGQRYQEGMHKKWVIHNFNAENWQYEWGLELSSSGVRSFNSLELAQEQLS
jgi:hypothetical protein